jgi:hypothetical protein
MAQDNEYVQKLIAARDREVTHRRDIVEALAEKQNRADTENMREAFIKIQDVIEPSSVPFGMRDISPAQSPSRSRLLASEADFKGPTVSQQIAKLPELVRKSD